MRVTADVTEREEDLLVGPGGWRGEDGRRAPEVNKHATHLTLLRSQPVTSDPSLEDDVGVSNEPFSVPRFDALALGDEVVRKRLILMAHPRIEELGPVLTGERVVLDDR